MAVRPSNGEIKHIAKNKPKTVYWRVIVPKDYILSPIQRYDLVFDNKDCLIRQIPLMFDD